MNPPLHFAEEDLCKVVCNRYFHFTANFEKKVWLEGRASGRRSRPWLVNGRGPPAVVLAGKLAFLTVQLLEGGIGPKVRTGRRLFLEATHIDYCDIFVIFVSLYLLLR